MGAAGEEARQSQQDDPRQQAQGQAEGAAPSAASEGDWRIGRSLEGDPEELSHTRWRLKAGTSRLRRNGLARRVFAKRARHTHIGAMHLDLSDHETAALTTELKRVIDDDRYPLSRRILTLAGILDKIEPQPIREPLPPPKVYVPGAVGKPRK
jgi:hypothetical protein